MKTKAKTFSGFHTDIEDSPIKTQKTAIFYLNNNNGYTLLDPKKKIKIKEKEKKKEWLFKVNMEVLNTEQYYKQIKKGE